MTLLFLISLLLLLPLAAGASYWGFEVFTLLILAILLLMATSLAEIFYLKKKLKMGQLLGDEEIIRGQRGLFSLPFDLDSRWLPARVRVTARHGRFDKTREEESLTLFLNLRPGDKKTLDLHIQSRHTGSLILDEVLVEVPSLLGFFKFKKRYQDPEGAAGILVLPLAGRGEGEPVRALEAILESEEERKPVRERSDELDTMRLYRPGDDIRTIHWPLSARMTDLVVKEYEAPVSVSTHILFDDFTGYSLETDVQAADEALSDRDRILDALAASIDRLLEEEREIQVHLGGLGETARERQRRPKDGLYYRRLLAHLPPDSLPALGQAISRIRSLDPKDRYLLFTRRLSENTAAALAQLARQVSQVILYYFEPEARSREEDWALRLISRSQVQVISLKPGQSAIIQDENSHV